MKTLLAYVSILFLLASCQKEPVLPDIGFRYGVDITNGGLFRAILSATGLSYQIDYGDGSTLETDVVSENGETYLQHKYVKNGTYTLIIIVTNENGSSWQKKEVEVTNATPIPVPNYKLTLLKEGNIKIDFVVNYGDKYVLDFGDGRIVQDSTALNPSRKDYPVSLIHQYNRNDHFKLQLSMSNIGGELTKTQVLNISNITILPIADFSYEILDNGRVKFTNLSTNALTYQWYIRNFNDDGDFYLSTQPNIDITLDLVGNYTITLIARKGNDNHTINKDIFIQSAKNQMEFSGYYEGKKIEGALESNNILYRVGFGSDSYQLKYYMCLFQHISHKNNGNALYNITKFYPLFPRSDNSGLTSPDYNVETRYIALKKYLSEGKDPDIIEVTEEVLDPKLYNNTAEFYPREYWQPTSEYYPKAFWIKYKVKNEKLDGIIKVRVMIRGIR